jgi:myosin-crossreactive antigen
MKDLYLVGSGINILSHYTIFIIKGWYSRFHGVEIHVAHGFHSSISVQHNGEGTLKTACDFLSRGSRSYKSNGEACYKTVYSWI